ncbi:MAG TPA: glutamate--tRNA ligase [Fimbriimonas sp.]|nr:glutamate--tRNA ligase [Fimbriimonas sp.]
MSVRVRFAPSPTGLLHVGALRDALFKHLFARHFGGVNILRIEDTDRTRYSPESEQEFIDTLRWVGIEFDEGPHIGGPNAPYRQSERKEAGIYEPYVQQLLESGQAYKAFETPEELKEMREYQEINKQPTGYFGGSWRDASPDQVAAVEAEGKPSVVRQRIPHDKTIVVEDVIRGRIEWDGNLVDDPVLIKGDGMPTYHFAAMVDDHLMGITHIMRGEEWISSAPKHAALFDSFGWERPIFVHMPVIVGSDGKKLSKRHGATRVLDYASQGFLPSALKNFIALIGWSPGDEREVMSEEEMIEAFGLRGLQPSPGRFDIEKLKWLNGHAIRAMDPEALLDAMLDYIHAPFTRTYWSELDEEPMPGQEKIDGTKVLRKLDALASAAETDRAYVLAAVKEEQQRVQTLAEFGEACEFFLLEEPSMEQKAVDKWLRQEHVSEMFGWVLEKLADSRVETVEHYETILKGYQTHKGMEKLGPVVHPTRVALTGKTTGPGLFELMSVLGHDRIERRLKRALELVGA